MKQIKIQFAHALKGEDPNPKDKRRLRVSTSSEIPKVNNTVFTPFRAGVAALLLVLLLPLRSGLLFCQNIAINSTGAAPNASAMLDIENPSKGLLIPRVSLTGITDVSTIATPANGLIVYNTNAAMTNGNGVGLYFYCSSGCTSTGWKFMSAADNGPGTSGQVLTSQGGAAALQWTTPVATTGGGGGTGCAACITTTAVGSTGTWSTCRNSCLAIGPGWRMPTWDEEVYICSGALGIPAGGWLSSAWTSTPTDARVNGTLTSDNWLVLLENTGAWGGSNYFNSYACRCVK